MLKLTKEERARLREPAPREGTVSRELALRLLDAITEAEARAERYEALAAWLTGLSVSADVQRDLTDWDHADVYRTLAEAIERGRAALTADEPKGSK